MYFVQGWMRARASFSRTPTLTVTFAASSRSGAATDDVRVGIAATNNDATNSRLKNAIDARWRAPLVIAWLERYVKRTAFGVFPPSTTQRRNLGVFESGGGMITLANDPFALSDDSSDVRVGRRIPKPRYLERVGHHLSIDV